MDNNSNVSIALVMNPAFNKRIEADFGLYSPLQKFVDHGVMTGIQPYMQRRTGAMRSNAPISTVIGSGVVVVHTPYAARRYYEGGNANPTDEPLAGAFWDKRWWADHDKEFLDSIHAEFGYEVKGG